MDSSGTFIAELLGTARRGYASDAVERQTKSHPSSLAHYGEHGFADAVEDTEIRLDYLTQALAAGRVELFLDHISWLKVSLSARDLSPDFISKNLDALDAALQSWLPKEAAERVSEYLAQAQERLRTAPSKSASFLRQDSEHIESAKAYLAAVRSGNRQDAIEAVTAALDAGATAGEVYSHIIHPAQAELGRLWQIGELEISEEHIASRIAERVAEVICQRSPQAPPNGRTAVIGTVGGDLHDLAARALSDLFELSGWRTVLLGASVPGADASRAIKSYQADLLALSASMPLHIRSAAALIAAVRADPEARQVPILIGGLPFQTIENLHQAVGADASAPSLADAVDVADSMLQGRSAP